MRIFHTSRPSGYGDKLNFVDDNNVLVGFDNDSSCCEDFGYYLTRSVPQRPPDDNHRYGSDYAPDSVPETKLDGYQFDPTFFQQLSNEQLYTDSGGAVTFRLVKPDSPDIYLTLYNSHNGYYSHGFSMEVGGTTIQEGSL